MPRCPLRATTRSARSFCPGTLEARPYYISLIERVIREEGQELLFWRDVPVDNADLGYSVLPTEPHMAQVFIKRGPDTPDRRRSSCACSCCAASSS